MALINRPLIGAVLAAMVLSVSALNAEAYRGTFNLPFETQWGSTVLKAGEYTLSTPTSTSWPQILTISGNGKTVYILAGREAVEPMATRSYLQVLNVNGLHVVCEFNSGASGKSFQFDVPKAIRAEMARLKTEGTKVAVMIQ